MVEELAGIMEHLSPQVKFYIGTIPVTNTVVNTWVMMAVLLLIAFIATRNLKLVPRGWQHLPEIAVEFIWGLIDSMLGKEWRKYLPLVGTLFIFILFLNLAWLIPGMRPPTMDLSTTAGFAIATIILVQIIAIIEVGLKKYIHGYLTPIAFLVPLNVIEECIKPLSLSLRLYGNMFGEEMVVTIIAMLVPLVVPTAIQLLGVLMGFIQAFVFTLLTITYLAIRTQGH